MNQGEKMNNVVVRFAPSPTGEFHIGSLRTALYNYLFAQKNKGKIILRIEDTDQKRYVKGSEQGIIEGLKWAGITYDEGPVRQSERLSIYKKYAQQLIETDKAYNCFCTPEELEQQRKQQVAEKHIPQYDRRCRYLSPEEIQKKFSMDIPSTIRLKVPQTGITVFTDQLRGEIQISNDTIEDQVLLKSDGYPTYHLSVVVDDHEMGVTHILRGDEWLSSTPKHILLYQAFGWELPIYIHLPPIQRPDKTRKLSKREGATSVEAFKNEGYVPDALTNYLALLGWNPGGEQEIISREEMIQKFDITKLQKAGAAFDQQKLNWFNQQYLMRMEDNTFLTLLENFVTSTPVNLTFSAIAKKLSNHGDNVREQFQRLSLLERQRSHTLREVVERATELLEVGEYSPQLLQWKKIPLNDVNEKLNYFIQFIKQLPEHDFHNDRQTATHQLEQKIKKEIVDKEWGIGDALWPLRASLSGKEQSPSPFELLWALGKEESLKRIGKAIEKIKNKGSSSAH